MRPPAHLSSPSGSAVPQPDFQRAHDSSRPALVCLSHLRWNFVYQRPQHLMSRFARRQRVYFVEEPVLGVASAPHLEISVVGDGVTVLVPHLPAGATQAEVLRAQRHLLDVFLRSACPDRYVLWYYTPMALRFTQHLAPAVTVYDCMDELAAFKGAPPEMLQLERELLQRADVVFTGGQSLYEAKRALHPSVHAFPSSVDVPHFRAARRLGDAPDQEHLPRPRLGFFGVIDERMDLQLLEGVARARPEWQLVLLGPVVKIDPALLPRCPNVHYLGARPYKDLPRYLAGWDVALLPFARNESTRFISPTKTPEYLAAGKPVVSTSIRDVVRPYGQRGLVRIADTVDEFVAQVAAALLHERTNGAWRKAVDALLKDTSWDRTWTQMAALVDAALDTDRALPQPELRGAALTAAGAAGGA